MENILKSIIISLISGGGTAFLIVNFLSKKIVDHQFGKSIERYKFKINSEFDRISKIHEKEFTLLPKLWELIYKTFGFITQITSRIKSYPDLNSLTELELEEFFDQIEYKESMRIKIRKANDRLKVYQEINFWEMSHKMDLNFNEFNNLFFLNRIFISENMDVLFIEIRKELIICSSTINNSNHNGKIDYKFMHSCDKNIEIIESKLDILSENIKEKLLFKE